MALTMQEHSDLVEVALMSYLGRVGKMSEEEHFRKISSIYAEPMMGNSPGALLAELNSVAGTVATLYWKLAHARQRLAELEGVGK